MRPLQIKFPDERMKMRILRPAKQLAQSDDDLLKNVYIKKDLTFKEMQEDKRLRGELKTRRAESTENGSNTRWIIRNGKVINTSKTGDTEREKTDYLPRGNTGETPERRPPPPQPGE